MAIDITINLNDEREAALVRMTNEANAERAWDASYTPLTPAQFLRRKVRDDLDHAASQYADRDRLSLREAYKQATPQEQAQIDAILNRYRR